MNSICRHAARCGLPWIGTILFVVLGAIRAQAAMDGLYSQISVVPVTISGTTSGSMSGQDLEVIAGGTDLDNFTSSTYQMSPGLTFTLSVTVTNVSTYTLSVDPGPGYDVYINRMCETATTNLGLMDGKHQSPVRRPTRLTS